PDIAINHNPAALALHAANHPDTLHLSENVYRVDPLDHLAGRHIGLMWFSPDCRHFSKAKGGAPVARNIRDLAWVIPGWIERIQKSGGQVDVVIMENVEEWKTWGPVIEPPRGPMPCPKRRGETFERWRKAIRRLGGKMETRELRACDYGAPTIRKRLFVIIRFDGQPIVWPDPTHGAPDDPRVIAGDLQPWRTAAECIDWSIPCPSIFDSAEAIRATLELRAVRPLADNTLARIARGVARYVLEAEAPFLVNLTHGERPGQAPRALDLGRPLGTIVAGGSKHAACAAFLAQQNGGPRMGAHAGHGARDPLSTVAASGSHQTPVATFFAKYYGTGDGARTDGPCHTITVKDRMAHMQAALQAPPFTAAHEARPREVAEFLRAHGAWDGGDLVTLDIAGTRYVIADIGMRMLTPRELFTAQGFPRDYVIEGVWEQDSDGGRDWRSFTKNTQVSCVGNSVCPPVAAAVVKANCGQLVEKDKMA
ncbi:DNA cytosine methyltransferase, partial [Pseudooceanicola marinus]